MGRREAAQAIYSPEPKEVHMDERIARLESDVAHIRSDVSEIKSDIRELRGDMKAANESISEVKRDVGALKGELKQEIGASHAALTLAIARVEHSSRLGLAANVVAHLVITGTVLAFMAKALKWI
jgi:chromosome segregation ATPase